MHMIHLPEEQPVSATISYGKNQVTLYRTYAAPLRVAPIPESQFTGRANQLFAVAVDVEVFGDNFLPAYTEGDNRNVVATDTMKNVVLKQALAYKGATLEGFLHFLGTQFLATYEHIPALRVRGTEQPFGAASVPSSSGFDSSAVLFSRSHNDAAYASIDLARDGAAYRLTAHQCGRTGLQLIKLTGSSFASFARDEHTTLPETIDRPLFIYLDVSWRYADPDDLLTGRRYLAAEQVRDFVQVVFHEFNSKSIQHLVYEMGRRLLDRFPQLAAVGFEAQNRLWDTAFVADDGKTKVYCDPRPPYGLIRLNLEREA